MPHPLVAITPLSSFIAKVSEKVLYSGSASAYVLREADSKF